MTWTQEDLAELEKAIASGTTTVSYSGGGGNKTVSYRSLEEMLKIRDLMRKELGLLDACNQRKLVSYSKGFYSKERK